MSKRTWSTILVVALIVAAAIGIYFVTRPPVEVPPAATDTPATLETTVATQVPSVTLPQETSQIPTENPTEMPTQKPTAAASPAAITASPKAEVSDAPIEDVVVSVEEKLGELNTETKKNIEELNVTGSQAVLEMSDKSDAVKEKLDQTVSSMKETTELALESAEDKMADASTEAEDKMSALENTAEEGLNILVNDSQKVKGSIWHTFTKDQEEFLKKTVADFNAAHPNYEIELLSQPYENFIGNVRSAVVEGVGPDIIFNYASEAAGYVKPGLLADLGQYIYDIEIGIEGFEESLVEGVMNGEVKSFQDGLIHYLPAYTTGPVLFYNKTLYDELKLNVPTTWDEMETVAKTIYDAKGFAVVGFDDLTDIVQMFIMETPGAGYIDVKNKEVLFDTPEVRARLEWFVDMFRKGYFLIKPTGNYFSEDFSSDIMAGFIGSTAGLPYVNPVDGKFEFAMAPIPAQTWYPSWNRGPIVFYYKDDARAQAAYEFVKYFISPEVNAGWVQSVVALTPYSWTKDNEAYKNFLTQDTLEAHALRAVEENLDIAGSLPAVEGASIVRTAIKAAVEKAVLSDMSVDEAWTEAVAVSNATLKGE